MSFVRALAVLAAGYAAAKGVDKYREMGGMAGIRKEMEKNPAMAGIQEQVNSAMAQMGVPGGGEGLRNMMDRWSESVNALGDQAAAGFGSLLSAMNGAAAAGAEQSVRMIETLTGSSKVSEAMEENAKLMIRAMVQAAKADGQVDPGERERIMAHLGDLTTEERAFIEAELDKPLDLHGLAMDTGEQMKAQVYAMSLTAVRVDSGAEAKYLDGLAAALGLDEATRAAIHDRMGVA